MTLAAYFSAPWVAAFFGEPQVEELVQIMSCVLLLHCVFLVPMAWLQRNLKFQTIAIIDLSAILGKKKPFSQECSQYKSFSYSLPLKSPKD